MQSPARGSRHFLQDRGRKVRRADATILFLSQPGLGSYLDRFEEFRKLANTESAELFVHPLVGSYHARVEGLTHDANADAQEVVVTCTFLAEQEPDSIAPVGAGVAPIAGVASIAVASEAADAELAAAGLTSPIPTDVLNAVTGWSDQADGELDSQQVFLDVASLSGRISDEIAAFDLATDLSRWPAYRALILLSYQLRRAGEAFTSDVTHLLNITITVARPLLAIAAELYGPELAPSMATKLAKINRIRTPARVPAGSTLRAPAEAT